MQKITSSRKKLFIVAVLSILFASVMITARPSGNFAKIRESPAAAKFDGSSDYTAQCARCHGGDGHSKTAKGRQTGATDLTKSDVSDTKGIRIITNGHGEMPAFKDTMNAGQISGVMGYIHGFRR